MKKKLLLVCFIILPVLGYEVFSPENYDYRNQEDKLLFVVDFSNSMNEYIEHKPKISQVKKVMSSILPKISDNTQVGLRVYGHTCNLVAFNACRSSELIVPTGFNNTAAILSELNKLKPKGMTPITYSLKQAVNKDFQNTEGIKHIILLTDGGENCDESPCDYAIKLMGQRRDIKIDVLAFDVQDSDDLAQLRCTADVTGGSFTEAETQAELLRSLENMILPHKKVDAVILK